MRVALVQLRLNAKSRAANVKGVMAAIARASQVQPAPDLLVLPGACDTGGATFGRGHSEATLTGVRETIAWMAREWGVFIAAGLHCRRDDTTVPCALLFDPDGDIVARSIAAAVNEGGPPSGPIALWPSVVGDIGVFEPSAGAPLGYMPDFEARGAFIAMPAAGANAAGRRRTAQAVEAVRHDAAVRGAAWWGVTAAAGEVVQAADTGGPATFLCDPHGHLAASAGTADETIVHAEVPFVPAPAEARAESTARDDHAD